MRSIIIGILLCVSLGFASAQVEKGMISFDGSINASQQWESSGEADYNPFQEGFILIADPSFSYLLSDHFMLGGGINTTVYSVGGFNEHITFIEPQLRYYFNPNARTAAYVELVPSWSLNYFDDSRVGLSLGINQFITEGFALETRLNYDYHKDFDRFNYRLGFRPFIRNDKGLTLLGFQQGSWVFGDRQIDIYRMDMEAFYFEFTPQIGYFFTDHYLVGIDGMLNFRSEDEGYNLTLHPYMRQYLNREGSWRWFGTAGVLYTYERLGYMDWHTNNWMLMADFGTDLFLSTNMAIEFKVIGAYHFSGSYMREFDGKKVTDEAQMGAFRLGTDISIKYFFNPKQ